MISKQLFISFLMCSIVSLHAIQIPIQLGKATTGIGVPGIAGILEGFEVVGESPETVQRTTPFQFPSPDEVPDDSGDDEVPHVPHGHNPPPLEEDTGHDVSSVLGGSNDTSNVVPEHVRVAEHLHTMHNDRILPEKLHAIITSLHAIHPRNVIIVGIAGGAVGAVIGYKWWQQRKATHCINTVLKKYGKNLSTISPVQVMLVHAAYRKDIDAVQNHIAHYGMEAVQGEHNAWVMPALEQLCTN